MRIFKLVLAMLFMASFALDTNAQGLKMPQASSAQTVTQEFGLGTITVKYSRPNVKNRKVFGGLVPYGEVWRTGANTATLISFTDDIQLEGRPVPAGDYALFTIPSKDSWTIILNKKTQQWGAYEYNQAEDFLRVNVKPTAAAKKAETFVIGFENVQASSAQLHLIWENTDVPVRMTTDVDSKVMANIEQAMKTAEKPYMQAAQYYLDNGKDLKKALEWANAAESADQKAPWVKYLKARIQLKLGDKKGAAATAEAGVKAAQEMKNEEYVRLNSAILADSKKL